MPITFDEFSITGLDPAAPLYLKSSYDAIKPSDAPFVDISKYEQTELKIQFNFNDRLDGFTQCLICLYCFGNLVHTNGERLGATWAR